MTEADIRAVLGRPDTREQIDRLIRRALGDGVPLTLIFHELASVYEDDMIGTELDDDSLSDILDALTGNHDAGRNYVEGNANSGPLAHRSPLAADQADEPVIREGSA